MTEDRLERLRIVITGRVQGVGYRWWFQNRAMEIGLTGWVRNRTNGAVEAEIQGTPDQLETLIRSAWQGPPLAKVILIDRNSIGAVDGETGFSRRNTV